MCQKFQAMNKASEKIKKYFIALKEKADWKVLLFLAVIIFSIFLRIYKFDDLLLFKGDGFRDAVMISRAYENGAGELPLLGPRAGGTKLRLGPAFYYFQYLSAVTSRSVSAPVLAYPTLIFSLLSIPVFWLLARKFFSRDWSMLLTGLFSLSFLAIEYSRFAWNPNSAPFFNLLFFHAFLEIFDAEQTRRRNWFTVLAGLSFAISSQLHFSNFLGLPVISLFFLILNWKRTKEIIGWKQVAIFILVVAIIYSPVILNDIIKPGSNAKLFLKAIKSKPSGLSIFVEINRVIKNLGKNFLRAAAGTLESRRLYDYAAQALIFLGLGANFLLWRKEKEGSKRRFLVLSFLTFAVFLLLYIPLAKEIDKPRFFLPLLHLPFIFLGCIGFYLFGENGKWRVAKTIIFSSLVLAMVFGSVRWSAAWLSELNKSQTQAVRQEETLVLDAKKDRVWWTWGHFKKTAVYMKSRCPRGVIYFIMAKDVSEYDHSFEYALKEARTLWPAKMIRKNIPYDSEGCYFFISRINAAIPKTIESFNLEKSADLGNISVTKFSFVDSEGRTDLAESRREKNKEISPEDKKEHRLYWKSVSRKLFTE